MDRNTPPDLSGMTGVPWMGRGRALQPQEPAVGRSRGLPLSTEWPGVGRARSFLTPGDTLQECGVTPPITQQVVGRGRGVLLQPDDGGVGQARGLLFAAAEQKVGVARGTILPSLELQHGQTPPCETMTQDLTAEEVRIRNLSILACFNLLNSIPHIQRFLSAFRSTSLPMVKHQYWSQCLEE